MRVKKEKKKEKKKSKWLEALITSAHRWAGVVAGPPGSGKTTFLRVIAKFTDAIYIGVKDNSYDNRIRIPEEIVAKRLSAVLHFTADGIRPAFDAVSNVTSLEEAEKMLGRFKPDIAEWISVRLRILRSWLHNGYFEISLRQNADELEKRLVIGLLYVARPLIPRPLLLDDSMAFIIEHRYAEAFIAMSRPFIVAVNRYLDSRDLLRFNPIVITPGGAGVCAA